MRRYVLTFWVCVVCTLLLLPIRLHAIACDWWWWTCYDCGQDACFVGYEDPQFQYFEANCNSEYYFYDRYICCERLSGLP